MSISSLNDSNKISYYDYKSKILTRLMRMSRHHPRKIEYTYEQFKQDFIDIEIECQYNIKYFERLCLEGDITDVLISLSDKKDYDEDELIQNLYKDFNRSDLLTYLIRGRKYYELLLEKRFIEAYEYLRKNEKYIHDEVYDHSVQSEYFLQSILDGNIEASKIIHDDYYNDNDYLNDDVCENIELIIKNSNTLDTVQYFYEVYIEEVELSDVDEIDISSIHSENEDISDWLSTL